MKPPVIKAPIELQLGTEEEQPPVHTVGDQIQIYKTFHINEETPN